MRVLDEMTISVRRRLFVAAVVSASVITTAPATGQPRLDAGTAAPFDAPVDIALVDAAPVAVTTPTVPLDAASPSKSPVVAGLLSTSITLGGPAIFLVVREAHGAFSLPSEAPAYYGVLIPTLAAFLVGPTMGHVYAGRTWNRWLAVRIGGIVVTLLGAALTGNCDGPCGPGLPIAAVGAAAYLVGAIGEIASAPGAANEYNREHHVGTQLTLSPIPTRCGSGPGIGLVGWF